MRYAVFFLLVAASAFAEPDIQRLHRRLSEVAPIAGVSIGRYGAPATWRIRFAAGATAQQRSAANTILSTWTLQDFNTPDAVDKRRIWRDLSRLRAEYQSLQAEAPTTPTAEYTEQLQAIQDEITAKRAELQ